MIATVPFVTVLITTYNYGRFIEDAIDSVLAQDFPQDKVQILVVDDGSTDDTSERVKKYGTRVEYFYKPNGGQASALNLGFAKAKGEIIALLDADDFFLPGKLSRVVESFQQNPTTGLVYHPTREWQSRTNQYGDHEFSAVSGNLQREPDKFVFYIPQPTTCVSFRRALASQLLPIPEIIRMNADCYLVALIPFIAPVLAIQEVLETYRIHGDNAHYVIDSQASKEARRRRLQTWLTLNAAMRTWLAAHGYTKKQPIVRLFLDRWALHEENQEFSLEPPGRARFFRHLLRYIRCHKHEMGWRLRLINYCNAFGALFTGYRYFPRLEHWRLRLFHSLGRGEPQMRRPEC